MPAKPRVFTASLGTETNTFSPIPTNRRHFTETVYISGAAQQSGEVTSTSGLAKCIRRMGKEQDWDVFYGLFTFAQPGGITTRAAFESLRDELLDDLRRALPLDGVMLGLHGAMIANGYPDCEGELLARIRELTGPATVIGAVLDPHAHLTEQMLENSNLMIFLKQYPHTDLPERSEELVALVGQAMARQILPVSSVSPARMIDIYHTTREPMSTFVRDMERAEQEDGVLSVSLVHGFPWGDTAEMGSKVLVVTDNQKDKGDRIAAQFSRRLFSHRGEWGSQFISMPEALERVRQSATGPMVLADASDNPGGGAPGDSTYLINAVMAAGIENTAFALLWDPQSVRIAMDAGVGERINLRVGGKTCSLSGPPLDLEVVVRAALPDLVQTFAGLDWHSGQTVCVSAGSMDIVLSEYRIQCFLPEVFTSLGVDLGSKKVIGVKSTQHFHTGFAPLASEILYVDTPGVLVRDLTQLNYRNADPLLWPFSRTAEQPGSSL